MMGDVRASVTAADLADWVTVAAYLLTAAFCLRAAQLGAQSGVARESAFWRVTAGLLILLGINELLDLQQLLTIVGRDLAQAQGWYEVRRQVQYGFLVTLALVTMILGLFALWLTRRMHRAVQLALVGLAFLGLFILVRAASFHHLDDLLGRGWQTFNYGSLQELLGIAIIAAAALLYARQPGRLAGVAKQDFGWQRRARD